MDRADYVAHRTEDVTSAIRIDLPWPPSVNRYWRHNKRGHTYVTKEGEAYRHEAGWLGRQAMTGRRPFACEVSIEFEAFPPDHRKRDLDNVLKATLDAMEHAGVYGNDYQVADLRIMRREVRPRGLIRATIRPLNANRSEVAA